MKIFKRYTFHQMNNIDQMSNKLTLLTTPQKVAGIKSKETHQVKRRQNQLLSYGEYEKASSSSKKQ